MPVSPADFEFYSRMTGQPIPNTPAGRMAIAPQVYNMRRGGGGFGRFLRGAAKGALAAGALAGAGALALATQEEMAKKPSAPKTETAKDQNIDLDSSAFTAPVESVRDKAEAFAAYTAGKVYNPQYSVGAPPKEKRARVTENLTDTGMSTETTPGGQKLTVSATDSPARMAGSPQILSGDALSAAEADVFDDPNVLIGGGPLQNRISGQTQVPQADPNTTFESRGAQIASTSEPTQPRVEVRQQPSSGVQVTDLSNVAATEGGMPAKETNPELSAIRQQLEMYEGSPTQSPFQAGGAMEELRRQSMDVKRSVGDLPRSIRGDVGVFLSNLGGQTAAPAPTAARSAAKEIQQQLGQMSERDQVQYQGGLTGPAAQGVYGALETGQDAMTDAPRAGMTASQEAMRGMMERGNVLASGIPQTRTVVPGPIDSITGDYRPFVSNKGREIGALLNQAQEKKAAAPTLKEIAGDALNLLNPFKGKKIDPREQQIRRDVDRTLGRFTPEQKEAEVRRRLGQ